MAPPIQQLAERLGDDRGLVYQTTYQALKLHIKSLSDTQFLAEMVRVDNPDIFGKLWAIGLTTRQQEMLVARMRELEP